MGNAFRSLLLMFAIALVVAQGAMSRTRANMATAVTPIPPRLERGGLVLTFDDRNFGDWIKSLPLFDKYNAHATFFLSGEIDHQALEHVLREARELHLPFYTFDHLP